MAVTQAIKIDKEPIGHYALDKLAFEGSLRVGSLFKESAGDTISSKSDDKDARHAVKITEKKPIIFNRTPHHLFATNNADGSTVLEYLDKSLVMEAQKRGTGQFKRIDRQGFGPGGYGHTNLMAIHFAPNPHAGLGDRGGQTGKGSWGGDGGSRNFD